MIVLVTGCRSGFGLLIAQRMGEAGHTVYASLRDLSTAGDLEAATQGLDVRPVQLDITKPEQREAVLARILEEQGRIDALVNNAGIPMGGFVEQVSEAELRRVMEVNYFATAALTQAVLPTMRDQRSGLILNISSMSGRMAIPGLGAYSASKHALEGLTEALRHEMRVWGVHVVNVQPGAYKTDIFGRNRLTAEASRDLSGPWGKATARMEALYDASVERTVSDPDEVARRCVALLTDRSPPFRIVMGKGSGVRTLLKDLFPFRVVEALMARILKLEPGPAE
ncbi:MAG: SDR family oxidoreductase [Alphaproteobacteria bacterium]|nr:SDR family oxidoreductase [Alphaproteobacteria bacterium]MCB9797669.1 SDR family oxidoreductase [Alphaproteobacteria bacterium]